MLLVIMTVGNADGMQGCITCRYLRMSHIKCYKIKFYIEIYFRLRNGYWLLELRDRTEGCGLGCSRPINRSPPVDCRTTPRYTARAVSSEMQW